MCVCVVWRGEGCVCGCVEGGGREGCVWVWGGVSGCCEVELLWSACVSVLMDLKCSSDYFLCSLFFEVYKPS